jgi:hypothetical protein
VSLREPAERREARELQHHEIDDHDAGLLVQVDARHAPEMTASRQPARERVLDHEAVGSSSRDHGGTLRPISA